MADAASLSDCNPLAPGGGYETPIIVADFGPPSASGSGEPLDTVGEGISALVAAGRKGPRKLAACASFILHIAITGLLVAAPNEVRIAGGRTTELAVVDIVLAPPPVVEAVASEEEAEPKAEPTPASIEPINEAMQFQASLPDIVPPAPVEVPQQADAAPQPVEVEETKKAGPVRNVESEVRPRSPAAEPGKPEEVGPEPARETDDAPELASVPVPQPKPDYALSERAERAKPKPEGSQNAERRPKKPRKQDVEEAPRPSRQVASGVGQRRSEAGNARVSNYPGRVVTKLRRALRYPPAARRDRLRGEAHVRFTVLASGAISGVRVTGSSGSPILDKAAVETVRRAAPFPDIPPAAERSSWAFTVPLAFRP